MQNRTTNDKSKLYCSQCGSFDLINLKRGFFARHVLNEPSNLHCQNCNAALSNQQYQQLWAGIVTGLGLFGLVAIVFMISPHSKTLTNNNDVYVQPILRLGDVELLRLDNSKNKNSDIEVVLLEEPQKTSDELAWEGVAEQVGRLAQKNEPVVSPILTIQQDLDRLLSN